MFMESVAVVREKGIMGDRYSLDSNRKSADYQITFIEKEIIDLFNLESGQRIAYSAPRRNIITQGVKLNSLINKKFEINGCEFVGIELCEPCLKLGKNISMYALNWFVGRGGLRCRIEEGGNISVNDTFQFQ